MIEMTETPNADSAEIASPMFSGAAPCWASDDGNVQLFHADCLDVLPFLSGIDAVITDPPYGINGSTGTINKARAKGEYGSFVDDGAYIHSVCVPAIEACLTLSPCVVMTPGNRFFCLYPQPNSFGAFYQPAAVGLQTFGNLDAQPIFYYGKTMSGKNMGKHCSFMLTEIPEKNGHPCVKPIKTWTRLVREVTTKGATVLDPFMGSGTTGVSCVRLGNKFIGIEKDAKYFEIAKERIRKELQVGRLF